MTDFHKFMFTPLSEFAAAKPFYLGVMKKNMLILSQGCLLAAYKVWGQKRRSMSQTAEIMRVSQYEQKIFSVRCGIGVFRCFCMSEGIMQKIDGRVRLANNSAVAGMSMANPP
jgi:hypothetical protein